MEMYLVVAMVIHMYDLKLMDPVPSPVSLHLYPSNWCLTKIMVQYNYWQ